MVHRVGRSDGEAVGPGLHRLLPARVYRCRAARAVCVELPELIQIYALDISADAPFGEAQRHPGLEPGDHLGLHRGMGVEIVVEPVGPGVHQHLQRVGTSGVERLEAVGVDEQPHPEVGPESALARGFGQASQSVQVVDLYPIEVVLRLSVNHPEHRVGVGFSSHMGDAPVIPCDAHRQGLPLPPGK